MSTAYLTYTFPLVITELKRYYYLTDHLGSIRATVKAGKILVADDFSGDLSKWQLVKGSDFSLSSGTLQHGPSGSGEAIRVNSTSEVLTDGIFSSSIKWSGLPGAGPGVILRYQDNSNFYWVDATTSTLYLKERISGTDYTRASVGASMASGTWYVLTVTAEGATIRVARNGSELLSWSGATRWTSGKVGVHYTFQPSKAVYWDNVQVSTGGPGEVVSADDYDAWGMQLEGRSINTGDNQARYKFTGKERDQESGYDYFGARYYDARIGRWMSVDPLAEKYPGWSPYAYAGDNPVNAIDSDGRAWNLLSGALGAAIGGIVGGVTNVVQQVRGGKAWNEVDYSQAGKYAAAGAVAGGMAGLTMGASLAATSTGMAVFEGAAGGALSAAAGDLVLQAAGEPVTDEKLATDVVLGVGAGMISAPVAQQFKEMVKDAVMVEAAISAPASATPRQVAGTMGNAVVRSAPKIIGSQIAVQDASSAVITTVVSSRLVSQGRLGTTVANGGSSSVAPAVSTKTVSMPPKRIPEFREQH